MDHDLPISFEPVGEEVLQRHEARGFMHRRRMVWTVPGHIPLSEAYIGLARAHHQFTFRTDDVVLLTYPKSGTTWASEVLWALRNTHRLHDMATHGIHARAYFMDKDFSHPLPEEDLQRLRDTLPGARPEDGVILQLAGADKCPRLLWSHLPPQLHNPDMLDTCKVVYVARNPRDVCVSAYHFLSKIRLAGRRVYQGDFQDFAEIFMDEECLMMPYWEHVSQAWELREHPNFHLMFFEDMKLNPMEELAKLNSFLELNLMEDQLEKVMEATSFEQLKALEVKMPILADLDGSFFRKGEAGDWSSHATPDLDQRMDAWLLRHSHHTGIALHYM